jgi:hypothetical protein
VEHFNVCVNALFSVILISACGAKRAAQDADLSWDLVSDGVSASLTVTAPFGTPPEPVRGFPLRQSNIRSECGDDTRCDPEIRAYVCAYARMSEAVAGRDSALRESSPGYWPIGEMARLNEIWLVSSPMCTSGVGATLTERYRVRVSVPLVVGETVEIHGTVVSDGFVGRSRVVWPGPDFPMRLWDTGRALTIACALEDLKRDGKPPADDDRLYLRRLSVAVQDLSLQLGLAGASWLPHLDGGGSVAREREEIEMMESASVLNGWWRCSSPE